METYTIVCQLPQGFTLIVDKGGHSGLLTPARHGARSIIPIARHCACATWECVEQIDPWLQVSRQRSPRLVRAVESARGELALGAAALEAAVA